MRFQTEPVSLVLPGHKIPVEPGTE